MLEVAEGIQYLHSEGIVHGDLHGVSTLLSYFQLTHHIVRQGNVLIDSTFHCQITDFGSTRHAETAVTQSTTAISVHFAAPELFGMCTNCCRPSCDGCHAGDRKEHRSKTMKTDVYAFGSLYYAVRFRFSLPYYSID
jgi:serine/threonine protein kinase